jgi:hypothetical protein
MIPPSTFGWIAGIYGRLDHEPHQLRDQLSAALFR